MIWETSQRPLLVKTVWIGGYRHAILSETENFEIGISQKNRKHKSNSPDSINETHVSPYLTAYVQKISPQIPNSTKVSIPRTSNTVQRCVNIPITPKIDIINQNPLSERVIQWLDLAGQEVLKDNLKTKLNFRHSLSEMKESNNFQSMDSSRKNYKATNLDGEHNKTKYSVKCENFELELNNLKKKSKQQPAEDEKCFTPDVYEPLDMSSSDEYEFENFNYWDNNYDTEEIYEPLNSDIPANAKSFSNIDKTKYTKNYTYATRKKLHIFIPSPL